MSIRRRLRSVVESRQASQICWRCTLRNPRYSTAQPDLQEDPTTRESPPVIRIKKHVSNKTNHGNTGHLFKQHVLRGGDAEEEEVKGQWAILRSDSLMPQPRKIQVRKYVSKKNKFGERSKTQIRETLANSRTFRILKVSSNSSLSKSPGTAVVADEHSKQPQPALYDRDSFRYVKFTGKNESPVHIKKYVVSTEFRKKKTVMTKPTQASHMPSWVSARTEHPRRSAQGDDTSHIRHEELDMLLDKLKGSPKSSLNPVAMGLPKSPSLYSMTSRQRNSRQHDMKARSGIQRRIYATVAVRPRQQRFASTLAPQNADVSRGASSLVNYMDVQGSDKAKQNIRERLKNWKVTENNGLKLEPPANAGSQSLSDAATDTTSQPGMNDRAYTGIAPDDDLDAECQLNLGLEENVLDVINPQIFLRPGDLVDLNISGTSILGIVISQANGIATSYTERGTWHRFYPKIIKFSVPHLVSSRQVLDLLPYIIAPKRGLEMGDETRSMPIVPRDVGLTLIEKMALFLRASDDVFRKYADRLNRAYQILTQDEPKGQTSISLEDAALQIFQKANISDLTPPMLLIVHRTLGRSQNILQNRLLHRLDPTFKILPQAALARLDAVRKWTREYQDNKVNRMTEPLLQGEEHSLEGSVNPLASFATKARKILSFNRQNRPLSSIGTVGPSSTKVELDVSTTSTYKISGNHQQSFDHNEQQIISFLHAWSVSGQLNQTSNLTSLGPMILRAVGMYNGMLLDQFTGFTLLQELGIVKPWERTALFESQLELPGHDPQQPATVLRDEARESLSRSPVPLRDSMLEFRKNWGDSRVFCVDSLGTIERDDGISLEAVDRDESSCWVHIHVANPSAFLSKDSPVARYARLASASVYFPENTYPMMEPELSSERFSLANGRPCITFSAKISAEGDIIEKEITHGTLNNVCYIAPEQVTRVLKSNDHVVVNKNRISMLTVGVDILPFRFPNQRAEGPEAVVNLSESDIDTFHKLYKISKTLHSRRIRAGAMPIHTIQKQDVAPRVHISDDESRIATIHAHQSRHIVGDPIISVDRISGAVLEAQDMVAEFMLLAGQACAMWCSERNIPVPYRGVINHPDPSPSPEVYRESILDPAIASQRGADAREWMIYVSLIGSVYTSSSPLEHSFLGLPAYCKVTSPLRRYSDLLAHWQIEAAIRNEHANRRPLKGSTLASHDDAALLPFSRSEVEDMARKLFAREKRIMAYSRNANKHWMIQALHRAFYFQEAPLPAVFEIIVKTVPGDIQKSSWGLVTAWNMSALLQQSEASDQQGGVRTDDVWEGKLVKVDPVRVLVILDPVRLVRRG